MGEVFTLVDTADGQMLRIEGEQQARGFHGQQTADGVWICPFDSLNAAALRRALPWTAPIASAGRQSIGCGDWLGLAAPGFLRAVADGTMFPVLVQQSLSEMQYTGQSPQDMLDAATWAVFVRQYKEGYGADADQLATLTALEPYLAAGFTGFTLDLSPYMDISAVELRRSALREKYLALPWDRLDTTPEALFERFEGNSMVGRISGEMIYHTLCKYGPALVHALEMRAMIDRRTEGRDVDIEISVAHAANPTTPIEHYIFVSELLRLGLYFQALAPRFIGRFEEAVDYIGDLDDVEIDIARHTRLARELGPYKLSFHAGADKVSLYRLIAHHASPYVHIKTTGTSWLEGLRVIARVEPALLRDVLAYALECYAGDRGEYAVSGQVEHVPAGLSDDQLSTLLDQDDARQILHVTYRSVLAAYRTPILETLRANRGAYSDALKSRYDRYIQPFAQEG